MKKIWFCLLLALFFGTTSCVRDTGNYTYIDVNELFLTLPDAMRINLTDTVLQITPTINQSMAPDISNLTFEWRHHTTSAEMAMRSDEIFSTEKVAELRIRSSDTQFTHFFWLEVTDLTTNIVYPFHTSVILIRPFRIAWTVLHSSGAGSRLAAIQYLPAGNRQIHLDVFEEFGRPPLTGAPVALGNNAADAATLPPEGFDIPGNDRAVWVRTIQNTMFLLTTNPYESAVLSPGDNFRNYIPDVYVPRMLDNFGAIPFDMSKTTYVNRPNSGGGAIINDGRLFHTRNGLKWYKANINPFIGDVRIDHALRVGRIALMFDGLGRRFLWFNYFAPFTFNNVVGNFRDVERNVAQIEELDRIANGDISLSNIDHQVLHIGIGNRASIATYQHIRSFAIANGSNSRTYIYLFPTTHQIAQTSANPSIDEIRVIQTPPGLDENSRFASSVAYSNIVFFSSGNVIYHLDFSTGIATEIYRHAGGGEIAAMRMARQEPLLAGHDTDDYGHPIDRSLGVAVNRGTTGELVILNLNEAGTVMQTEIFRGFGQIKDIHFVCDVR